MAFNKAQAILKSAAQVGGSPGMSVAEALKLIRDSGVTNSAPSKWGSRVTMTPEGLVNFSDQTSRGVQGLQGASLIALAMMGAQAFAGAGAGTTAAETGTLMPAAIAPSSAGYTAAPFASASGAPATAFSLANPALAAPTFGATAGGTLLSGGGGGATSAAAAPTATGAVQSGSLLSGALNAAPLASSLLMSPEAPMGTAEIASPTSMPQAPQQPDERARRAGFGLLGRDRMGFAGFRPSLLNVGRRSLLGY